MSNPGGFLDKNQTLLSTFIMMTLLTISNKLDQKSFIQHQNVLFFAALNFPSLCLTLPWSQLKKEDKVMYRDIPSDANF